MNEFEAIERFFAPLTQNQPGAAGLKNDGAILSVPPGFEIAVTTDTLNAGTHFLAGENPANIARKALRVNLSDLTAMGARPYCYQLALAFPQKPDESWLAQFTGALLEDQKTYGLFCSGGDTTSIHGALSVSITALGLVPAGQALTRAGAKPGDFIVITGPVGLAALGLKILQGTLQVKDAAPFLKACQAPEPPVLLAESLRGYAHAAIDISDGLIADLGHICRASGLGARLEIRDPAIFGAAEALLQSGQVRLEDLLTGGDDYEILAAVPPAHFDCLQSAAAAQGKALHMLGAFTAGSKNVEATGPDGQPLVFSISGWAHF